MSIVHNINIISNSSKIIKKAKGLARKIYINDDVKSEEEKDNRIKEESFKEEEKSRPRKLSNNSMIEKERIYLELPQSNKERLIFHKKNIILNEWLTNIENNKKIEKDIEGLFIEIYTYHFNNYPDTKSQLSQNALELKFYVESFSNKLYEFPFYILSLLKNKFYKLNELIISEIKELTVEDIHKIKKVLDRTGKDIKHIFKASFDNTQDFDVSSILTIIFFEYILNDNKINENITEKQFNEIISIPSYEEKDRFEQYLDDINKNFYFSEYEDDYDEENEIEDDEDEEGEFADSENEFLNIKNEDEISCKYESEHQRRKIKTTKSADNLNFNIKCQKKKKEEKQNHKDDTNKLSNNNGKNISREKRELSNNNSIDNQEDINARKNWNLDELVNYINDPNDKLIKKKRKKKKKSKIKKNGENKEEEKKEERIENIEKGINKEKDKDKETEDDPVIINFKATLEEYSKNLLYSKKFKPTYSPEFLLFLHTVVV